MEGDIKVISASFALLYKDCMQKKKKKKEPDKNQCNTEQLYRAVTNRRKMEEKKSEL